jgi:hypothetical protein
LRQRRRVFVHGDDRLRFDRTATVAALFYYPQAAFPLKVRVSVAPHLLLIGVKAVIQRIQ